MPLNLSWIEMMKSMQGGRDENAEHHSKKTKSTDESVRKGKMRRVNGEDE